MKTKVRFAILTRKIMTEQKLCKERRTKTMTMNKLEKILEDEIKACKEHCETYKQQGCTTLWEISDVRRQTCEDILKKIRES